MPPFAVNTDKTTTKHNGIEQQAVTLRCRRNRRMPGMGTVVHLIKAGALILAEIERLDRMAVKQEGA